MRIKLIESAIPINKLEYNIKKNIIPELNLYNFNFLEMPTKPNMYVYAYNGSNVTYKCPAKLILNTADKEIDIFNAMDDKPYTGDLFATLYLNSQEIPIGVISSKDPQSINYALENIDFDEYTTKNSKSQDTELIPSHDGTEEHTVMEWIELSNKLKADRGKYKQWYNNKLPLEDDLLAAIDPDTDPVERERLEKIIDKLYFFD